MSDYVSRLERASEFIIKECRTLRFRLRLSLLLNVILLIIVILYAEEKRRNYDFSCANGCEIMNSGPLEPMDHMD